MYVLRRQEGNEIVRKLQQIANKGFDVYLIYLSGYLQFIVLSIRLNLVEETRTIQTARTKFINFSFGQGTAAI